jgi:ABC-type transporter Mla MlaB component
MAAPAPQTVALAFGGPITRAHLPGLCEQVSSLLERSGAAVVLCDVAKADSDVVTVDALARVQLAARRHGCDTRIEGASSELVALLNLVGLRGVLPV